MIKKLEFLNKSLDKEDFESILEEASDIYTSLVEHELLHLKLEKYSSEYSSANAVEALGLDEELVNELVEDYVAQMIKSLVQFEVKLEELEESKKPDYTPFRELAHKNLGVARNLRIENAEVLLYELMTQENLDYLMACLEALEVSTIKLNAKHACKTLKLIEIKDSFKV